MEGEEVGRGEGFDRRRLIRNCIQRHTATFPIVNESLRVKQVTTCRNTADINLKRPELTPDSLHFNIFNISTQCKKRIQIQ